MTNKTIRGKILIVDDEKGSRDLVRFALKGWGLEIKELESGEAFHETVRSFQPDLLILDFQMPSKDGMILCEELREYDQATKVIWYSSTTEKNLLQKAYKIGFQDCFDKTASLMELRKKVGYWLVIKI